LADWSDEETDNPLRADDRNFYKVAKWTKDGTKVDRHAARRQQSRQVAGHFRESDQASVATGGLSMEEHSALPKDQIFIRPLHCEECGGNAHLIRRSPHFVNCLEIRTFECQECEHQMERIVKE
jgi:hypothetical protein